MKAERLAQALYEMTHTGKKTEASHAIVAFVRFIKAKGYEKLFPRILEKYEAILKRHKESGIVLTTSRKKDTKHILASLSIQGDVHEKIDETLIGGYTLETKDSFTDASYKSALLKVYQSITH
jgi:F0F1-type ATP synthase delta subunit